MVDKNKYPKTFEVVLHLDTPVYETAENLRAFLFPDLPGLKVVSIKEVEEK